MRKRIACWAIAGLLLAAAAAPQEEPAADESQAELIEQIEELQRQIEELLAQLPPEVREAVRQRLAKPGSAASSAPEVPAEPVAVAEAVPAAPEEAAAEPARADPPPAAATWSAPRRRPPRERCNTLLPLDGNGDGKISSADRHWRHFYVWTDKSSDGRMQDREIESAYDLRIREIDVSLETFLRAKGGLGEIRLTDRVVLDLRGDGFSDRARRDDGVLLLDAGAVRRGDGPALLGPDGETLDGFQPFRAGLGIRVPGGDVVALSCPRGRAAGD